MRLVSRAIGTLALAAWAAVGTAQPGPPLVYMGDREFPPYDYVDGSGAPRGFNVELVRALSVAANVPVDIRMASRADLVSALERHEADLAAIAYGPQRVGRFEFLAQTWTLSQVVLLRPPPGPAPKTLADLRTLSVAIEAGTVNADALESLSEGERPLLVRATSRDEAIQLFRSGRVNGVAGNHLTLAALIGAEAAELTAVPITATPYYLGTYPGNEARVRPLLAALPRLRASGAFDRLIEQHLTLPTRASWLERYSTPLGVAVGIVALTLAGGIAWNRSLSRQVKTRTVAVERSERQFRELVEYANDMIYRCSPTGHFTFVNPVATRILGYSEDEITHMRYADLIRPDWVERATLFYQDAARSFESTYLEFPVITKDGRELWIGQTVRPLVSGGHLSGFQGVARDVTDRVAAQAALRAERDFASAVLEMAPSLVMVLDREGRLMRYNRACEDLAGVPLPQVQGKPIWEMPFLLDEDREAIRASVPRLAAATAPVSLDRRWVDAHGGRHLIAWTISALRDLDGEPVALIGVGNDVTVTRELEKLKTQFVSMVSHELRTPLTSIRASMQLLLADGLAVTDPDTTQLIGISLSNAERLIRIVNDILDMSKIEAGEMVVDPTPVSVAPILGDSVRSVEAFARGSGVELRVSMPSGLPTVNIDPDRTVQILVNLLSNAVKHAPAGTSVDVVARVMPDGVAIDIRDHGPGIPAGKIKLIFEPFTQLDGSDTRRIAGTGLGLTIARALAERQGGSITVASLEGDGATFTLTLPRSRP